MDVQQNRWSDQRRVTGIAIVAFVIVAGVVLAGSIGSRLAVTAAPSPEPTSTPDEHVVSTPGGDIAFRDVAGMLVVSRTFAGQTVVLNSVSLANSGVGHLVVEVMVCPAPDGGPLERYILGRLDTGGQPITYSGPPAIGQGAGDGLFLFVLLPGELGGDDVISVTSVSGDLAGTNGDQFTTVTDLGRGLPSGCMH
jgi:hypothetical protein